MDGSISITKIDSFGSILYLLLTPSQMKNFYKTQLLALLLCMACWKGTAQQDAFFSLYRHHLNIINPAAAGTQEGSYLNMSLRSQWLGIDGAPETQAISYGMPTNGNRVGIGFSLINDQTFIEKQTQFYANFSYRLPLSDQLDLFLGLCAGANGFSINAAGLDVYGTATQDPNLMNFSRFNPNIGAGVYLKSENFYFSFSVPRMLSTERYKNQNGLVTSAKDRAHFYTTTGFRVPVTKDWEWIPSVVLRHVKDAPALLSLNMGAAYKKQFELGENTTTKVAGESI